MCGIVGYYATESDSIPPKGLMWEMVKALLHRGPDAQAVYCAPGVGLGHTRLSIIDLDARSNQPMQDPDTGCVIVFNGEIYNYIELREELVALGYRFTTPSDTEVILKAYEHWGIDCLNRFNGMWAFAIFDARSRKLFAARDRFGIKPFLYGQRQNGDLVFASEAKAIISVFSEFREPNLSFLTYFLESSTFAGNQDTPYQGLYNLLPGHYFIATAGEIPQQHRYWTWQPLLMTRPKPKDTDVLEEFQALLKDSIRLRFRSDVPVGSCLSGGLDSSTIVGLASSMTQKQLSTFSCIYPEFPELDESFYIKECVQQFQTAPHYIAPTHEDFLATMHRCVWEQDGPTGGPGVLSQRAVMALAKGKVTVLLDGQGADEVLGGYHSFFPMSLLSSMRDYRNHRNLPALFRYWNAVRAVEKRTGAKQPKFKTIYKQAKQHPWFAANRHSATVVDQLFPYEHDYLNTLMLEAMFTSLPDLLHYEDRNSMAHSLESRLPYLDYRLVEFAFSLPHSFKIRGSRTKWMLWETAQSVLPKSVLHRKDKMGFNTPGQVWFRQPEVLPMLNHLMRGENEIWRQSSQWLRDYWQNGWNRIITHQPVGTFAEECSLWRYFTAVMFLEQWEKDRFKEHIASLQANRAKTISGNP